jgi:hypothetical protein
MLVGRPPFRSEDETILVLQHLRQKPSALQVLLPDLPPVLSQIVDTALAKEPAARYRNAGQFAQILRSRGAVADVVPPLDTRAPSPRETGAPVRVPAPPVQVTYAVPETGGEGWGEGFDWILLALAIAALLAVLGLIPLWRAVAARYTATPVLPAPRSEVYPIPWGMGYGGGRADTFIANQVQASYPAAKLPERGGELVDGAFSGIMTCCVGVREPGLFHACSSQRWGTLCCRMDPTQVGASGCVWRGRESHENAGLVESRLRV